MDIDHYIITRINLGVYSSVEVVKPMTDYVKSLKKIPLPLKSMEDKNSFMMEEIKCLKQFSIPSIMYQTNKNFKWIWLVDKGTPEEIKEQLISLSKFSSSDIIFDEWKSTEFYSERNSCGGNWVEQFRSKLERKDRMIACTRYDIDDYLSSNFVQVVQNYFDDSIGCIDFEFRITIVTKEDNTLYMTKNLSFGGASPIVTLVEKKENIKTPYCKPHYRLNKIYPFHYYSNIVYAKVVKRPKKGITVSKMEEKKIQDVKNFENLMAIQ